MFRATGLKMLTGKGVVVGMGAGAVAPIVAAEIAAAGLGMAAQYVGAAVIGATANATQYAWTSVQPTLAGAAGAALPGALFGLAGGPAPHLIRDVPFQVAQRAFTWFGAFRTIGAGLGATTDSQTLRGCEAQP